MRMSKTMRQFLSTSHRWRAALRPTLRGSRKRTGASLIELLACIAILTSILVLAGTSYHLLLRADKTVSQSFVTERTISQLAIQFRDDVHRSASGVINVDSATEKAELQLGDADQIRVKYLITGNGLVRLVIDGDAITAREDYRLPDCRIRFSAGDETDSPLRMLIIERPGAVLTKSVQAVNPRHALTIQASLDRFASPRAVGASTVAPDEANQDLKTKEDLP